MKKTILLLSVFFTFFTAQSQNETYKEVLLDFMQAQGTLDTFNSTIDQMSEIMGNQIEAEKIKPFMDEMFSGLIDALVPVYQKHLSIQDLKDGIGMYQTPIGKKIAEKSPQITQETMGVSMEWGMQFSSKIQELMEN
tara:strand:+ start:277 stop:687 length:411 start_codon:yes stop_codon:yes gene_type:complete